MKRTMKTPMNVVRVMGAAMFLWGMVAGQASAAAPAPVDCDTLLYIEDRVNDSNRPAYAQQGYPKHVV